MRIKFVFYASKEIKIPLHYNYLLQSSIYRSLPPDTAHKIHELGWRYGKRKYSLFTFSKIFFENYRIKDTPKGKYIFFTGELSFKVASVSKEFLEGLASGIIKKGGIEIDFNYLKLQAINIEKLPFLSPRPLIVTSISPVTTYSTYIEKGKKKTFYFSPKDKDFFVNLKDSLYRKAKAYYPKKELPVISEKDFLLKKIKRRSVILYTRSFLPTPWKIIGWYCVWELRLPKEYLFLALCTGLGSRTSQGLGMVEEIESEHNL